MPCAAQLDGSVDRLLVALATVDREPAAGVDDPRQRRPVELLLRHEA
jgi:hypothetical protein